MNSRRRRLAVVRWPRKSLVVACAQGPPEGGPTCGPSRGLSRFEGVARLKCMGRDKQRLALAAVVLLHLAVSMAHGSVHTSAGVDLSAPALVFVVAVIIAGPLIGLAWMWVNPLAGTRLIGIAMAAS